MERLKALVVENSTVYQSILQQLLNSHGFTTLCVKSGQEALDLIEFNSYDQVCLAMTLADISGIELCKKIRALPDASAQNVPISMITAEEDKAVLQSAMRAGATHIFSKRNLQPFDQYLDHRAFSNELTKAQTGHVMYLEDSESQSMHGIALLESHGYSVTHFKRAEDVLPHLNDTNYDLVLTDVILDGNMTGLDLVKRIREDEELSNLPVLALSAAEDGARRLELLRLGANDYITKPVVDDELLLRVQNCLKTKKLIERLQDQQIHLQNLAMKDQLTGLYNRHFLMEVGPKRISEAHRHKQPLALLVIDVDKFKRINDNHGHSTGDAILSGLADVFQTNCRNEDIASRFGGEEFVLLLTRCGLADAEKKAENLRQKIEKLCPSNLTVTVSIGVTALLDDQSDNLAKLFDRADRATYMAKEQGRNRVLTLAED